MIDYTAMIDRKEAVPGHAVKYVLNDLQPPNDGAARTYSYSGPDTLQFPSNQNPLLSNAISLEIRRKVEALRMELG